MNGAEGPSGLSIGSTYLLHPLNKASGLRGGRREFHLNPSAFAARRAMAVRRAVISERCSHGILQQLDKERLSSLVTGPLAAHL